MNHLILFFTTILSTEIFLKSKLFKSVQIVLKFITRVKNILADTKVSDTRKEKVIPIYAFKIMYASLKIIFLFLIICLPFTVSFIIFSSFLSFFFSFIGAIECILISASYFYFRNFRNEK